MGFKYKVSKKYKGYNGTIILNETSLIIKRGFKGFLLGGGRVRGDKTIPYTSIVAVQYKKAGIAVGFLQVSLRGGSEAKGGVLEAVKDENTVTFLSGKNKQFLELKEFLETQMDNGQKGPSPKNSPLDDLEKLAQLNQQGIITDAEFKAKKKQILGL